SGFAKNNIRGAYKAPLVTRTLKSRSTSVIAPSSLEVRKDLVTTMKSKLVFTLLCFICAALPAVAQTPAATQAGAAAQTGAPDGMALVPAGKFWIGRSYAIYLDSGDLQARDKMDDRPANNIYLDAFYIDKYEINNTDYAKFVQATGARAPWHWPEGKIPKGEEKYPAANVNWYEASDYCKWVGGKRLPTEAEWEKAARGGLRSGHHA